MCCSSSRLQSPWRKGAVLTADELKTYKSNLTGPELDEALRNICLVQENIEKAAGYAETSEKYGTIVEQNQAAIQAIEDNLDLIQRAPQNAQTAQQAAEQAGAQATAAAGSAAASAQSEEKAAYWADQAQTIAQGAVGWYQNAEELRLAHPTGENGQWAIVGNTDTVWTWDSDTGAWINTATRIDLSNYYTKAQTDAQIKTAMSNTGTLVYGSSVTTGTVNNGGVGTIGTLKIPSAGVWMVAASGWKPDAISKGIVSIDNIGGCSLSEYQFCLAGVMQCSGATTLNLNVTNWSGNAVNGQQSAGLIFRAVKISG